MEKKKSFRTSTGVRQEGGNGGDMLILVIIHDDFGAKQDLLGDLN